jgi:hypothetical protein
MLRDIEIFICSQPIASRLRRPEPGAFIPVEHDDLTFFPELKQNGDWRCATVCSVCCENVPLDWRARWRERWGRTISHSNQAGSNRRSTRTVCSFTWGSPAAVSRA